MARHPFAAMLDCVGRAAVRAAPAGVGDSELLRRFSTSRDPAAFAMLVWRHGAMVHDVCRRTLGQVADADDAFQATFLVLARHAPTIRSSQALAGWLHRVARRVSLRARRQALRRRHREKRAARPEAVVAADVENSELRLLLDQEIERLPARYREAFILCQLEGRNGAEAARELGCPTGTVHSRLARARERLRARLTRRGIVPVVGPASVISAALVGRTVRATSSYVEGTAVAAPVAALLKGAVRPMMLPKLRYAVIATVALAAMGSGAVFLGRPAASAMPRPTPADETLEDLRRENARLRRELAAVTEERDHLRAQLGRPLALSATGGDKPTEAEVLRALLTYPRSGSGGWEIERSDLSIVFEKLVDRTDPPRVFPLVGPARLRHCHWKCTVYFTETVRAETPFPFQVRKERVEVVYINKDSLAPEKDNAPPR